MLMCMFFCFKKNKIVKTDIVIKDWVFVLSYRSSLFIYMATKNQYELPSPPTFSQMMEDLEIMSADDKIFKLFQLEQYGMER